MNPQHDTEGGQGDESDDSCDQKIWPRIPVLGDHGTENAGWRHFRQQACKKENRRRHGENQKDIGENPENTVGVVHD
jgi:hypothetical protein